MNASTEALLNGANRAFDFANMTVCGHDVHFDRADVFTNAIEFIICMYIAYC